MEYFLHHSLLKELIYGSENNRKKIESYIQKILEKSDKLSTSCISIYELFNMQNEKKQQQIIHHLTILTDNIYDLSISEINQGIAFSKEYEMQFSSSVDLAICLKHNVSKILCFGKDYDTQSLISVIQVIE